MYIFQENLKKGVDKCNSIVYNDRRSNERGGQHENDHRVDL
jgi:hypothetical protein